MAEVILWARFPTSRTLQLDRSEVAGDIQPARSAHIEPRVRGRAFPKVWVPPAPVREGQVATGEMSLPLILRGAVQSVAGSCSKAKYAPIWCAVK